MKKKFTNAPPSIFNDANYIHYVIEYQGDIISEASNITDYYLTIIDNKYAIISLPFNGLLKNTFSLESSPFKSIVYISRYSVYTLQETQSLSPIIAANINLTQIRPPFYLTGKDVVVGLIDTGIDFLNKEFMDLTGSTRILSIWDQTVTSNSQDNTVPFGSVYNKEDVNNAIKASISGKDPYEIVPSKDLIGHGTAMAGVIGATGVNPTLKGAAPECEFVMVKLVESLAYKSVLKPTVPIYDRVSIMFAINYLYEYAISNNKPLIIYLPLGTTAGNHRGEGFLQNYIDELSNNKGIAVITGSGNEANAEGHTSGVINKKGDFQDIQLYISPEQEFIRIEIWISKPNIMSVDVISASGESSGTIPVSLNQKQTNHYIFEKSTLNVSYYFPEETTGDELIVIEMKTLKSGTWKFRLTANYVLDGTYNAWLPPKGVTKGGTKFIYPDPYGTLTNPGSSQFIITVANYNQNNFNLVNSSGMGFLDDFKDRIDIAAGGVNVLTLAPNNQTIISNGTSVSAAVVAGASAIMFEWGIIKGHDPDIYSQTLKSYLTGGAQKRLNDFYPNPEWGYGALDMLGVFKYLE